MYFKMTRAAVIVAGGAAALCLGSVPAALAAPASGAYFVPCSAGALHAAIEKADPGATLDLAPGCTYYLPDALPEIMHELTIVGYHSTLTRARDAGGFSLLEVGCEAGDLTVINVSFTDGGGYDVGKGGAIYNDGGTLHVTGGTFSDNESNNEGGAIYNDGDMTVDNAAFTGNLAHYGGTIFNSDDSTAFIRGSDFAWNKAPTKTGAMLYNSYGGAIYNAGTLHLANSEFLANSTGGYGGAIYNDATLDAAHITATLNSAAFGGGIYNADDTTLFASVVFGNNPDNCVDVTGC